MTELPDRVQRALADADALSPTEDDLTYEVTTTPFEATVLVVSRDDEPTAFDVTVWVPTLSAAVDGEVADVVQQGWLETFERRLEDAGMALQADGEVQPTTEVVGEEVAVEATLTDADPGRGAADATALVEYVEGTYLEGVVPGYDYRDPVASMRERAEQNYE